MKYDLELVEEQGKFAENTTTTQSPVGGVDCPSIQSVAAVAHAIAIGYAEHHREYNQAQHLTFSVIVWEHNTNNKVVQCWTGSTRYFKEY